MNIEIKFRAWDDIDRIMMEVSRLNFCNGELIGTWRNGDQGQGFNYPSDRIFLMQYTGIKDKNGQEIYEGDIVDTDLQKYIVKYIPYCGWFPFGLGSHHNEDLLTGNDVKVIGNKFQNPELVPED